jgi:hypothetical protein
VNLYDQSSVIVTVVFSDPGTADTHDVTWAWGDSNGDTQTGATSPASESHAYDSPGVYAVTVTVADDDGGSASEVYEFVVIYDPSGGFVTGGGWFWSPAGAYAPDPDLAGKANFGFVSRYKKGATVPEGNTEFQFKAGDLNFHSSSYDWLVVNQNDTNAQFKGSGMVNGGLDPNGNAYRFMVWAGDSDEDTFRIRIWWEEADGGEHDVYDNGVEQVIGGGNIVVHAK